MGKQIIAVDLGGTQIRTARYDEHLNLLQRENTLTLAHEGLEPTLGRLKEYIHKVMPENKDDVRGIGFSAPGPLNPMTGVIVAPPNLDGWHNVPLADIIHEEFDVPVFVGNDANVAALAEATKGAAKGYRHVIYLTISTGIGGGMICDGLMLLGREGLGAEAGHIPLIVGDGKVSSIELEAAGPAIAGQVRRRIQAGETSIVTELVNDDLSKIDAKAVGQAAAQGDSVALEQLAYAGRIIGIGIVSLLHLFNPEIIVIGGGVSKTGDLLFKPMWDAIRKHVIDDAYLENFKIEMAGLGDDVALVGAAALVASEGGRLDVRDLIQML
jgi:glucokinase